MPEFIISYAKLIVRTAHYLAKIKFLTALFLVASITVALSEGVSVLLLIPILDNGANISEFSNNPYIGPVAVWLGKMELAQRLVTVAVMLGGVIVIRGAIMIALQHLSSLIYLRTLAHITNQTVKTMLDVDMAFIHGRDYGSLRTFYYEFPVNIAGATRALADSFSTLILISIYLVIMVAISWKMTLASLLFLGVLGIVIKGSLTSPLNNLGARHADAQAQWANAVQTTLLGGGVIRLSNAQKNISKNYDLAVQKYISAEYMRQLLTGINGTIVSLSAGIFICALIAISALYSDQNNSEWMLTLIIFIITLFRMSSPASAFISSSIMISAQLVSFERWEQFMREARNETMPNGDQVFSSLKNEIRFEDVSFQYSNEVQKTKNGPAVESETNTALKNINLVIPRGQVVALVGPSGAGKTTLASLICRLYDPTNGKITIDGVDLRSLDVATWRKRVSLVSQDIYLFNDSILNNIGFGLENYNVEQIHDAARQAVALEFIEELTQGWDTKLGEMGVRLSGGQKQRISIAKSILADPDVLILDEATSHLDSITEKAIQTTVNNLAKGRTVIVIAHRLSTIKKADNIVVLEKGRIVESGSHDALIKKNGRYKELLVHQVLDVEMDEPVKGLPL